MKKIFPLVIFLAIAVASVAQGKFYTKSGRISFYSSTSMENIEAINKSVVALLDTKTGDLQFAAQMKGFEFKKALMQEHFNRDFAESNKFPKAEFKGQLSNNSQMNYSTNGAYAAKVKGTLTVHGVSKEIEVNGTLTVKDGKVYLTSVFNVLVANHNITIPKLYRDNISKSIEVKVDCTLVAM
ncbi:MAG: YceI family protein [Chitinophagaceae bacterium]|nr:YceI family protein [Chitinophagaceae bacterium]